MSLNISLSVAIASNRETFVITDNTVYGGINPLRVDLRVFVKSFKMAYDNTATELEVTPNIGDPKLDTYWSVPYVKDGWYKTYFVIIPEYDVLTSYSKYDAVFSTGDIVYRSKVDSNEGQDLGDTNFWEVVEDPATLAANKGEVNESPNIDSLVYNRVLAANGKWGYGNIISDQCQCTDCDESETLQTYNVFAMWLDTIDIDDARGEVLDGEALCRRVESKFL